MHPAIEELSKWGCDTECLERRFFGDEDFYISLLKMTVNDASIAGLKSAIEKGDAKAAFICAHTLKGMLGNMGLTRLYKPICEVTELFRGGVMQDAGKPYTEFCAAYDHLKEITDKYLK